MSETTIEELRIEVLRQWIVNHDEHCGHYGAEFRHWPHDGMCMWPLPSVILGLPHDEIVRLMHLGDET